MSHDCRMTQSVKLKSAENARVQQVDIVVTVDQEASYLDASDPLP